MAGIFGTYQHGITAGLGWIAVALVIFAGWRPWRALIAAYVFGALRNLGFTLQIIGVDVPSYVLNALPFRPDDRGADNHLRPSGCRPKVQRAIGSGSSLFSREPLSQRGCRLVPLIGKGASFRLSGCGVTVQDRSVLRMSFIISKRCRSSVGDGSNSGTRCR